MLSRLTAISMTTEEKASTLRASRSNTDRWQEKAADLELGQASLHGGTQAQSWLAGLRNPEGGRGGSLGVEGTPFFLRDRVVGRKRGGPSTDLLLAEAALGGGGLPMGEAVRCQQC